MEVSYENKSLSYWNKSLSYWNKSLRYWNKSLRYWNKSLSYENKWPTYAQILEKIHEKKVPLAGLLVPFSLQFSRESDVALQQMVNGKWIIEN